MKTGALTLISAAAGRRAHPRRGRKPRHKGSQRKRRKQRPKLAIGRAGSPAPAARMRLSLKKPRFSVTLRTRNPRGQVPERAGPTARMGAPPQGPRPVRLPQAPSAAPSRSRSPRCHRGAAKQEERPAASRQMLLRRVSVSVAKCPGKGSVPVIPTATQRRQKSHPDPEAAWAGVRGDNPRSPVRPGCGAPRRAAPRPCALGPGGGGCCPGLRLPPPGRKRVTLRETAAVQCRGTGLWRPARKPSRRVLPHL